MVSVFDSEVAMVKSDDIVPVALAELLRTLVHPLEDVFESSQDWRLGSGKRVLDLVNPSLSPLIYGHSKALAFVTVPLDDCFRFIDQGEPIHGPIGPDIAMHEVSESWADPIGLYVLGVFQWLPSDVHFPKETGSPKIASYINNLHPVRQRALYEVLEQLDTCAIPLWNECLSGFGERFRIELSPGGYSDLLPGN
ncbi:hypothetical protein FQN50_004070 [Emmonsiellopsis sp. PD_5]|nr:hypothetical protein FQN50_004070 [Emmonsiellopsis sp. PD_5]